ncbi:MAG: CBS domain-containing protein [Methyloceanibacter sp.]|nr:CBS domain-containing protein [Methyloceanibacter sp.]
MTNRKLTDILGDQELLTLREHAPIREACRCMWTSRKGSVLVIDQDSRLVGIFTGRDAVHALAEGKNADTTPIREVMTLNPTTAPPSARAVDALRAMSDRGIRHLPIVDDKTIYGVVSRGDFKGMEIDRLDDDDHVAECLR